MSTAIPTRALAVLAASLCLLAGCSSGRSTNTTTSVTGSTTGTTGAHGDAAGLNWIVTREALSDIATNTVALSILEQGQIYEIVRLGGHPLVGVNAIITADFKSVTGAGGMQAAVTGGLLPTGTKAILYDPESWSFTPLAEQQHLATYISMAASLARSHGYQLIVSPALDLTKSLDPATLADSGGPTAFLQANVDKGTDGATVVDVQAQSQEISASTYSTFVKAVAGQISSTNSAATVVAGVSSNPSVGSVTAGQVADAMTSVLGVVKGYWLNIPTPGPSCPDCGAAQPEVMIDALLEAFGGGGSTAS